MKTIKLSVLLALSVLFVASSYAQVRIGPSVGFNYSTLVEKDVDNDFIMGLRAGITLDLGIAKFFSIVPEVNFSQMGYKCVYKDAGQTEIARLNYIQVPLNLVFKIKLDTNTRFLLFTGAYGAYAIGGNIKIKIDGGGTEKSKAPFGTNQGQINPLDIGLNLGLGLQVKKLYSKFQYNMGINSLSNNKEYAMLNGAISLSLGFFIK